MRYEHKSVFDAQLDKSYAIALGDLDGDKDVDIVIANHGEPNTYFINQNQGTLWKKYALSTEAYHTYDIVLSDLNGDGRLDIIESNSDEQNLYYFSQ